MPTIVDSLLIQIGIDPAQLIKGGKEIDETLARVGQAGDKAGKTLDERAHRATESMSQLRTSVIGLFATFATGLGIKSFVENVTVADSSLGRFAANIGANVKDVAGFQAAVERYGGTSSGALSALQNFVTSIFQAQHGLNPEFIGWIRSLEALSGKTIQVTGPIKERLASLAEAFKAASAKDPVAAQLLANNLHVGEAFNLLRQGRAQFEAEMAKSNALGLPNDADTAAAQKRVDAYQQMSQAWTDTGRKIATDFTPAIIAAEHALTSLAGWAKANPELADEIAAIAVAFVAFKTVAIPLELLRGIASLGTATRTLGTSAATTTGELKALAAAEANAGTVSTATAAKLNAASEAMLKGAASALRWRTALAATLTVAAGFDLQKSLDEETNAKKKFGTDTAGFEAWKKNRAAETQKSFGDKTLGWIPGLGGVDWSKPLFSPGGLFGPAATPQSGAKNQTQTRGAPQPEATKPTPGAPQSAIQPGAVAPVADLIARGEGDYNSVNRGSRGGYKSGTADLANMTVDQVQAAQAARKFNAAGRYQVIGSTLKDAVAALGLKGNEKFDASLQDRIFQQYLIGQKRPAIGNYVAGRSDDLRAAVKAGAAEWASIADPDSGQSRYAGVGNNRASISADEFGRALVNARAAEARLSAPQSEIIVKPAPAPISPAPPSQDWRASLAGLFAPAPPSNPAAIAAAVPGARVAAMTNMNNTTSTTSNDNRDMSSRNATVNIHAGSADTRALASAVSGELKRIGLVGQGESGAV